MWLRKNWKQIFLNKNDNNHRHLKGLIVAIYFFLNTKLCEGLIMKHWKDAHRSLNWPFLKEDTLLITTSISWAWRSVLNSDIFCCVGSVLQCIGFESISMKMRLRYQLWALIWWNLFTSKLDWTVGILVFFFFIPGSPICYSAIWPLLLKTL